MQSNSKTKNKKCTKRDRLLCVLISLLVFFLITSLCLIYRIYSRDDTSIVHGRRKQFISQFIDVAADPRRTEFIIEDMSPYKLVRSAMIITALSISFHIVIVSKPVHFVDVIVSSCCYQNVPE